MAITRPAKKTTETFIGAAPDAGRKGVIRGRREQITLTIAPDLLARVDQMAERMGQSRAALINLFIYRGVEGGHS
jgi:Ribbon-helix-helix protein, copG family